MRNIQSFSSRTDVQTALDERELRKPYVALVSDYGIDWNGLNITPPFSAQPLTFEIISGGTVVWKSKGSSLFPAPTRTIEYSINGGEWTSITSNTAGTSFSVSAGDNVQFRGNNQAYTPGGAYSDGQYCYFGGTAIFKVYGNIGSLISSTAYTSLNTLGEGALANLFRANNNLLEVTDLSYGNNYLTDNFDAYAFKGLFKGCSNLNYVKFILRNNITSTHYFEWLNNTAATGTLVLAPGTDIESNLVPSGWTVVNAEI